MNLCKYRVNTHVSFLVNTVLYYRFRAQEDEVEDEVDSDFSIDENDEPVSDNEEENSKKKRRLVTKAYKVRLSYFDLSFFIKIHNF